MTIASKALHKSKQNLGSGWYNIEHWLQAFSITFKLRLFQVFMAIPLSTGLNLYIFSGVHLREYALYA